MKVQSNSFLFILKLLFLFLICFSLFSSIQAQNEIPDSMVIKRFQYIQNTLEHDRLNTNRWWYGWLGAYSAATIGQGVIYFSGNEKSTRQDMALGAATTLLGAVGQFVSPVILGKETGILNSFRQIQLMKDSINWQLRNSCSNNAAPVKFSPVPGNIML